MRKLCTAALTWVALLPAAAGASWEPSGWHLPPQSEPAIGSTNPAALALTWAVRGYQNTASRVDGDRCPSYPSCSHYAVEALRHHGPFLGTTLTAGRLISEADEAAFAPRIRIGDRWLIYSPLKDDLAFLGKRLEP